METARTSVAFPPASCDAQCSLASQGGSIGAGSIGLGIGVEAGQALRLRLLARLQLRAFDGARADARALSRAASLRVRGGAERWRDYLALAHLAEAAAEVGLGSYEAAQEPTPRCSLKLPRSFSEKGPEYQAARSQHLAAPSSYPGTSQLAAAWRRVGRQAECFQRLSEGGFSDMSTVYFVEDDAGGGLDEEGVAGVAAEVEEAAWHVAVSLPAFPDYVCEDLKALSATLAASGKARRGVGLLSTGEVQPPVGRDVLQGLSSAEAESPKRPLGAEQLFGVLKTNAFSCASEGWGLWVSIAFVNHACCPNAQYVITEKEEGSASSARGGGLMLLRAAKDLSKGDEVTFEYFGTAHAVRSYPGRQAVSQNHGALGFTCNCPRCAFENRSKEEPFFQELRRMLPQLEALSSENSPARLEEFSLIVGGLEHLVSLLPPPQEEEYAFYLAAAAHAFEVRFFWGVFGFL
ncbi:N-lysine methyltransferase SMYD2 [Symbiodinium microadriaticum]|uniref:N-lysine methyltransferase SMYD2 n=1 Tax=Symbiodinium microadriaticum TaxID=2951 RepID=A0A1Q9EWP6_SYMMI|nr:N-lysine methyltransferase SMYD2 [Symbiodinium microadriaticum]